MTEPGFSYRGGRERAGEAPFVPVLEREESAEIDEQDRTRRLSTSPSPALTDQHRSMRAAADASTLPASGQSTRASDAPGGAGTNRGARARRGESTGAKSEGAEHLAEGLETSIEVPAHEELLGRTAQKICGERLLPTHRYATLRGSSRQPPSSAPHRGGSPSRTRRRRRRSESAGRPVKAWR